MAVCGALSGNISPVCFPLPGYCIPGIHHPNGTALIVGPECSAPAALTAPLAAQQARIVKQKDVCGAPNYGRTGLATSRSPGIQPELFSLTIVHGLAQVGLRPP